MKLKMTTAIAVVLSLAALANSASAATVKKGWTRPNEESYFLSSSGDAQFAAGTNYIDSGTNSFGIAKADIEWVWARTPGSSTLAELEADRLDIDTVTFTFEFDLTGFDVSTALLSGEWAVDNDGEVALNGTVLNSLTGTGVGNMNQWHSYAYGSAGTSLFNAGMNSLTFTSWDEDFSPATDTDLLNKSTGGIIAIAEVTATPIAAMPLPAGAWFGISALALMGAVGRRRKA